MRFNDDKPIYEQIADSLCADAAAGRLSAGGRIPSARELAASLEVNPNTAARALQMLADRGVARMERGTGYFLADDGAGKALAERRRRFFDSELPMLFSLMEDLGVGPELIAEKWAARNAAEEKHT
ncbi:MAG: GntR family transcriptional regulator [Treponemataceae bacterium]|jgi:DNA-binding transcriptional regulator YhcF (GntR family)